MNIKDQLIIILSEVLKLNSEQIDWDNISLLSEVGLNSVNYIKLLIQIEDVFEVEVSDEYLDDTQITTFEQLYQYVNTIVTQKP